MIRNKRFLALLLTLAIAFGLLPATTAFAAETADITYTTGNGDTIYFDSTDFAAFFEANVAGSYQARYVTLSLDSGSFGSDNGFLYYKYDQTGQVRFTESTLSDQKFYIYDDLYGDYALDLLCFVPGTAENATILLNFTVYYSSTKSESGTLEIQVGDGSDTSSADLDVLSYGTEPGEPISLDADDFNAFFQDVYGSSYDIKYIYFEEDGNFSSTKGYLFAGYTSETSYDKKFTNSALGGYEFYYDADVSGYDPEIDYLIDDLTFVPLDADGGYTACVTFTAYYSSTRKVSGTLEFSVDESGTTAAQVLTLTTDSGEEFVLDAEDFNDLFQDSYPGYDIRYVRFDSDGNFSSTNGYLYSGYDSASSYVKKFTNSSLDDYDFYYEDSSEGTYALDSLTFVPGSADDATISVSFVAYNSSTKQVEGTLKIVVGAGESAAVDADDADLAYQIGSDDTLLLSAEDFYDFFDDEYTYSSAYELQYVTFSAEDFGSEYGYFYAGYSGSSSYDKKFTNSSISDYQFFYGESSTDYDASSDYLVNDITFVPGSEEDYTIYLDFTACYSSSRKVTGVLKLIVGDGSVTGDITYAAAPGGVAVFSAGDFEEVLQEEYSTSALRYVTFGTASPSFSSSNGYLYYNYGQSDQLKFSSSTLKAATFYASSDSYGDYPLDAITFVAGSEDGSAVSVPFIAYYSSSRYVEGILVLSTDADAGGLNLILTYTSATGEEVNFDADDFTELFQKVYPTYTPKYVAFSSGSSLGDRMGYLYSDYGSSGQEKFTSSSVDNYIFYLSSSLDGDYDMDDISWVPGSAASGTVTLSFTAYYSSTKSVEGTLKLILGNTAIAYTSTVNGVCFSASDFASYCQKYLSSSLSYVYFQLPSTSVGRLYYNYTGITAQLNKVSASTKYYYTSSSGNSISQVYFLPAASFSNGSKYSISFVAYDTSGNYCNGTVSITMSKKTASSTFTDVGTSYSWAADAVDFLSANNVVNGLSSTTFGPAAQLRRGDFVLMLYRAFNLSKVTGASTTSNFADVSPTSYYAQAIAVAKSLGIATGDGTNFYPERSITRQEAMTLVYRAMQKAGISITAGTEANLSGFTDKSSIASWASTAVATLVKNNIVQGANSLINPAANITRAEMAVILHRCLTY